VWVLQRLLLLGDQELRLLLLAETQLGCDRLKQEKSVC
jgi:hypothetical protein